VVAAKGQAIRGVGQRYFSERLPNLRIATDDGRPAAHVRRLSGIVSPDPAGELRCCGVLWGVPGESDEEFAICPQCRVQKYVFERARRCGQ
jgi:hypothetical protein